MKTTYRDLTCGDARPEHAGREVTLSGWVNRRRDMGQLIFIDLRDRYGVTQVVIDADRARGARHGQRRPQRVRGLGQRQAGEPAGRHREPEAADRRDGAARDERRVLSTAKTTPFPINDADAEIDEALRLKHRYLDLRREPLNRRLLMRSKLLRAISDVHHAHNFVEVETPILIKSTPEGARDFIVPSRLQPGKIYALPQSPQQLKQLLMVARLRPLLPDRPLHARRGHARRPRAGVHPARPRDELRRRRGRDGLRRAMVTEVSEMVVPDRPIRQTPFPRFTYREAMDRFGSDKPDVRFGMELHDVGELAAGSGFRRLRRDRRGGRARGRVGRAGIGRRIALADR